MIMIASGERGVARRVQVKIRAGGSAREAHSCVCVTNAIKNGYIGLGPTRIGVTAYYQLVPGTGDYVN